MAEVEEASTAQGGASRSSWPKTADLMATFSGSDSWTMAAPSTASSSVSQTVIL